MSISPPDPLLALLRGPNPCFIATVEPDGAPQLTQTWIDTDGTHVLLNTVEGHRKLANMARDPRVAINICDRTALERYWVLRGHVVDTSTDGAADHIETLSQRYTGGPYQNYGGSRGGRVLVRIAIDRIVQKPW